MKVLNIEVGVDYCQIRRMIGKRVGGSTTDRRLWGEINAFSLHDAISDVVLL